MCFKNSLNWRLLVCSSRIWVIIWVGICCSSCFECVLFCVMIFETPALLDFLVSHHFLYLFFPLCIFRFLDFDPFFLLGSVDALWCLKCIIKCTSQYGFHFLLLVVFTLLFYNFPESKSIFFHFSHFELGEFVFQSVVSFFQYPGTICIPFSGFIKGCLISSYFLLKGFHASLVVYLILHLRRCPSSLLTFPFQFFQVG